MEYNKENKKVAYALINMDNFSTIDGTGSLEICVIQILINLFKFIGIFNCDDEFLQRHCQESKSISTKTTLLVYIVGKIEIKGEILNKHCVKVSVLQ